MNNLFDVAVDEKSDAPTPANLELVVDNTKSTEGTKMQPTPEPLTLGHRVQNLWNDFLAEVERNEKERARFYDIEQSFFGGESYSMAIGKLEDYEKRKMLHDTSRKLLKRLVTAAENQFRPPSGSLSIDIDEVDQFLNAKGSEEVIFDAVGAWQHLESTYGGKSGEDLAWQQLAAKLIDRFGLNGKRKEVVRKAGRVLLEISVYLDDFHKKYGKNRLHYNSQQNVVATLQDLAQFACWHNNFGLSADLQKFQNKIWMDRDYQINSRENTNMGDDKEIILVVYHNKFEFKLSEHTAAKLQQFLGTYGNLQQG